MLQRPAEGEGGEQQSMLITRRRGRNEAAQGRIEGIRGQKALSRGVERVLGVGWNR